VNRYLIALIGLVVLAGGGLALWRGLGDDSGTMPVVDTAMHGSDAAAPARPAFQIVVPQLTSAGQMGKTAFDKNCAACHGENGVGTDKGPPLVHKIYEPSHHGDYAFMAAARNGVKAHHWRFGDMPPVPGLTDRQVEWIVTYVREVQRANGIQ